MALFGPVGPNCAPYSVQLDKETPEYYSANYRVYRPQNPLYRANNLGTGEHTVRITSQAAPNSALTFAIDYAQIYSTPSLGYVNHVYEVLYFVG